MVQIRTLNLFSQVYCSQLCECHNCNVYHLKSGQTILSIIRNKDNTRDMHVESPVIIEIPKNKISLKLSSNHDW